MAPGPGPGPGTTITSAGASASTLATSTSSAAVAMGESKTLSLPLPHQDIDNNNDTGSSASNKHASDGTPRTEKTSASSSSTGSSSIHTSKSPSQPLASSLPESKTKTGIDGIDGNDNTDNESKSQSQGDRTQSNSAMNGNSTIYGNSVEAVNAMDTGDDGGKGDGRGEEKKSATTPSRVSESSKSSSPIPILPVPGTSTSTSIKEKQKQKAPAAAAVAAAPATATSTSTSTSTAKNTKNGNRIGTSIGSSGGGSRKRPLEVGSNDGNGGESISKIISTHNNSQNQAHSQSKPQGQGQGQVDKNKNGTNNGTDGNAISLEPSSERPLKVPRCNELPKPVASVNANAVASVNANAVASVNANAVAKINATEGGKSASASASVSVSGYKKVENTPVVSTSASTPISKKMDNVNVEMKPSATAIINKALTGDKVERAIATTSTSNANASSQSHGLKKKEKENQMPPCDDAFKAMVNLDPIPPMPTLKQLSPLELARLEHSLQIGEKYSDHADNNTWREDWNGNLQLVDKDIIMNRDDLAKNPSGKRINIQFCDWVAKIARHADDFEGIRLLFSFVYHMKDAPLMAKQILAYHLQRPATSVAERLEFVLSATRRISYDPAVLCQDGWTTLKSDVPDGHTGGSHLIGRRAIWHSYEAIVIAFVRDEDIGDLWKCMWVEDHDTFDLEADELQEGMKKWEKKVAKRKVPAASEKNAKLLSTRPSSVRFEASRNFTVDGVEDGIVLAKSYKCKSGRPWPARIMHVTEVKELGSQVSSRRSSSKSEVHVVFLAPYWNGPRNGSSNGSGEAQRAKSQYSTGPLFELETMDVSSETLLKYPYSADDGEIFIQKIKNEFSFLGLPKAAFSRFLDAHRIALSLKAYARRQNKKTTALADSNITASFSSLTDTHPLSIKTFSFPDAMLNLPFGYILSKYPSPMEQRSKIQSVDNASEELKEPIMQLHLMLQSIVPPICWGDKSSLAEGNADGLGTPKKAIIRSTPDSCGMTPTISPSLNVSARVPTEKDIWTIDSFASEYLLKHLVTPSTPSGSLVPAPLGVLNNYLRDIVQHLNRIVIEVEQASVANLDSRQKKLSFFIVQCMATKGNGEEYLFAAELPKEFNAQNILREWRKACERAIKRAVIRMGHMGTGNGVTAVITDSRCNEHITANGSFERAVRLPAALKGAKMAGAGSRPSMPLITKVEDEYLSKVEDKILPMAHKSSYLKRIKDKVSSLPQDAKGVPLTDDSDGEGGEDTMGSRGSFTAAVTGVAAALKGVDMIIEGKCVNAFCAVRPPGHHAGRELRPMNAMSNGFCLLNTAASAALYAATPRSQGGLGLNRVCVIDIDVHHGNGTQDILCSTHDPRFFYVSTHAGGSHINGYEDDSSDDGLRRSLNMNKNEGIFPGRCGDTNPHPGVLNVPLGKKVTPSDLGTKLVSEVTPAVEKFDPELIIISAGFDAHVNDPLGMGGLSAVHFGTVTQIICQMALKSCSGRVLSILEGGYGVPCCRPLAADTFLPNKNNNDQAASLRLLSLGDDLPDSMNDQVDFLLAKKLDKCHQEGFLECVREHVKFLAKNSGLV